MKMSKTEETRGVRVEDDGKWYNYNTAPIICKDSKTGRDLQGRAFPAIADLIHR